MNNLKLISFCLICLGLISYKPRERTSSLRGGLEVIRVEEPQAGPVDYNEFIEDIRLMPLERPAEPGFRSITEFIHRNGRFYIYDMSMQELFIFDESDGRFEGRLNNRGDGPDQYLEMRDVEVDDNGNIHVLSHRSIIVYDSTRKYLRTISFMPPENRNVNPTQFAIAFGEGYYLYHGSFGITKQLADHYCLYKINEKGDFSEETLFPVTHAIMGQPRFYKIFGEERYTMTPMVGNDTVYALTEKDVTPLYYIDYGSRKLPDTYYASFDNGRNINNALTNHNFVTMTQVVMPSQNYVTFSYRASNNIFWNIYSKNSGRLISLPVLGEFGVDRHFPRIKAAHQDGLVGYMEAHSLVYQHAVGVLKDKWKSFESYETIERTISSLTDKDHVVIAFVTLKKF